MTAIAQPQLPDFYARLAADNLAPLWENLSNLVPHAPPAHALPMLWTADLLREHLAEAGRAITAAKAERRVLVLENPAMPGKSSITPSLYAGIQMLLPGESVPSHRHSAAALRLFLSGEAAYTAVDGERVMMVPGDFLITPSWSFHDHGNQGADPATWLDGLDVHIVNLLGAPFGEPYPGGHQPPDRLQGESAQRYGRGLVPANRDGAEAGRSIFHWPYADVDAALNNMKINAPADPALGWKVAYIDPLTGRSPLAAMSAFMQRFPAGFEGLGIKVTDGTVYCVVEGDGEIEICDRRWDFARHDVFVVPSWARHRFRGGREATLFSFSDRVLQQQLGLWREEREAGPDNH